MLETVPRVVLIADAAIEERLLHEIERLQFPLCSSVPCSGHGPCFAHDHDRFASHSHVRIEAIGSTELVRQLLRIIHHYPFDRFSLACFVDTIQLSGCAAAGMEAPHSLLAEAV